MIIDPELRKVVREVLREKKRTFQCHRSWKLKAEAVSVFLNKNKAAADSVKKAQCQIKRLEKAIAAEHRKIRAWGLNNRGDSIDSVTLFKKNGGVVAPEPTLPPSFESVMSELAAATTQSEATKILSKIGVIWKPASNR